MAERMSFPDNGGSGIFYLLQKTGCGSLIGCRSFYFASKSFLRR